MKAFVNIQVKVKSLAISVRDQIRIYPGVVSCDKVIQGKFDLVAVIEATGDDQLEGVDEILTWINRVPNIIKVDANFVEP